MNPIANEKATKSPMALLALAARVIVGGTFLYLGALKAADPIPFLKILRQYDVIQDPFWLNALAGTIPWIEIALGILIVAGIAIRGAALTLLGMLAFFSVLIFLRAQDVAAASALAFCDVKFDCGCGTGEVYICPKLLTNFGLIVLSALLLSQKQFLWSLKPRLFS